MDDEQTETTDKTEELLASIKQRALESLLPLVDSLEVAPERKFEILMTVVRSSNDPEMLNKALLSAQQIENQNAKTEALLDILNETNFQLKS